MKKLIVSNLWVETIRVPRAESCVRQAELLYYYHSCNSKRGGSVAEWLACWTQAQKGLGSNRSSDAVG